MSEKKPFWLALLIWTATFVLLVVSSLLGIALTSVGIVAVFTGIGLNSGFLERIAYIATDVTPNAMLFLGTGCAALAVVIFMLLFINLYSKNNVKLLKNCATFGAIALTSVIIGVVLQTAAVKSGNVSTVFAEEIQVEPKNYISINVTNSPVEINNYSGEKILVKYLGETPLKVTESENRVAFAQDESFAISLFTLKQFRYKLEIFLPKMDYRALEIASAAGNVTADTEYFRAIEISAKSGNISARNISAAGNGGSSAVTLKSRQGKITAEFSKISEAAEITSGSGNIQVKLPADSGIFLKYVTAKGHFTSDFFKKEYVNVKPPLTGIYLATDQLQQNDFTIITETGNLQITKYK